MAHRTERLAEAIREVVAKAVLFEVADPRVRAVTVLTVDVSRDRRYATVHVSIMGTSAEQQTAVRGLESAKGFLQSRVANRLQTRFTPILSFKLDESVKKSVAMSRLIEETLAADRRDHPTTDPQAEPTDEDFDDETDASEDEPSGGPDRPRSD